VNEIHSRKIADPLRELLLDVGNLAVFPGKSDGKLQERLFVVNCAWFSTNCSRQMARARI